MMTPVCKRCKSKVDLTKFILEAYMNNNSDRKTNKFNVKCDNCGNVGVFTLETVEDK